MISGPTVCEAEGHGLNGGGKRHQASMSKTQVPILTQTGLISASQKLGQFEAVNRPL